MTMTKKCCVCRKRDKCPGQGGLCWVCKIVIDQVQFTREQGG